MTVFRTRRRTDGVSLSFGQGAGRAGHFVRGELVIPSGIGRIFIQIGWSFRPELAGSSSELAGHSSELAGFSSELGGFSYELAGFLSKTKGADEERHKKRSTAVLHLC
ncbi:MAG: hypothetical protein KH437_06345 [Prevotella sp.]|nr:hypothetical protein [Prevotella sp.]